MDSGPVGSEEPLVFWNKEENVQKEPGRPPLAAKKSGSWKPPKRVSFAEDETTSIDNESMVVENMTDKLRKEPSANQTAVSEEPITVLQSSRQDDKTKSAAAKKTPDARHDAIKRDSDRSVSAVHKPSIDIDASKDENRDEAKSKSTEGEKCVDGMKPRTAMANSLTSDEKSIVDKSEKVERKGAGRYRDIG